jgi:hypothetical protein
MLGTKKKTRKIPLHGTSTPLRRLDHNSTCKVKMIDARRPSELALLVALSNRTLE